MAVAQAGQANAQDQQQQDQEQQRGAGEGAAAGEGEGGEQQPKQAARTYSQEEVDRILGKVRKNARYLGRKEAEAELRSQGATGTQARDAVDRQEQQQTRQQETEPVRKDDESYEDFVIRKAEFAGRKASREEREDAAKKDRTTKAAEQRTNSERAFKKRADDYIKDHPEFAEKVESAEDVMISPAMGDAIQESELSAHILDYLIDHPDESERIAGLEPKAAERAILRLEAKLEAGIKKPEEKKDKDGEDGTDGQQGDEDKGGKDAEQSQERRGDGTFKPKRSAPDPIEPGSARSASTTSAPSDKDDMKTWVAKREAEERKKRGR